MVSAGGEAADHSMLQALCSQRDRFRAKANELQEALSAAQARASAAAVETAAARADNVALVERLKYVSSYSCVPHQVLLHDSRAMCGGGGCRPPRATALFVLLWVKESSNFAQRMHVRDQRCVM